MLSVELSPSKAPSGSGDCSGFAPSAPPRRSRNNSVWLFHAGKFFQNGAEVLSAVGAERSWYIFPNSESWVHSICRFPHFPDDSHGINKKTRPPSGKSRPASRNGQILARTAERDAIHRLYLVAVNLCNIAKVDHVC
jgi:hypothetical protein